MKSKIALLSVRLKNTLIWGWIKFFAWLIPLGISISALLQSSESNNISRQALIVGQRPYVTLQPTKFEEIDSYIFARETEKGVETKVRLKLTNTGKSIAKNIKTADIFITGQEIFPTTPHVILQTETKCQPSGIISLAPDESIFLDIGGEIPVLDRRAIIDQVEKIKTNEYSFPFNIEIYYDTDLEPPIRGKTASSLIIKPQDVEIKYTVLD